MIIFLSNLFLNNGEKKTAEKIEKERMVISGKEQPSSSCPVESSQVGQP